jgi:hypothetical protein
LTFGASTFAAFATDAQVCLDDAVATLSATPSRADFVPLRDEVGDPVGGGLGTIAWAVYTWQGGTGPVFEYLGCFALPEDRGVVFVNHRGPLPAYEAEAEALEDVLVGGLDLAVRPAAAPATPPGPASYEDAALGWSIAWDPAAWTTAGDDVPAPADSALTLVPRETFPDPNRTVTLFFIPLAAYGGDPVACIDDAPALINGWAPASPAGAPFDTATPLLDESGRPLGPESPDGTSAAYVLDDEGDGIDATDPLEVLDCRPLVPGGAVLLIRISYTGLADDPAAIVARGEAIGDLLDGLVLPSAAGAGGATDGSTTLKSAAPTAAKRAGGR